MELAHLLVFGEALRKAVSLEPFTEYFDSFSVPPCLRELQSIASISSGKDAKPGQKMGENAPNSPAKGKRWVSPKRKYGQAGVWMQEPLSARPAYEGKMALW